MGWEFLFAGAVGALLPFVLGVLWNQIQDRQRRRSERTGLLKLVHIEVVNNDLILDRLAKAIDEDTNREYILHGVGVSRQAIAALNTTAWDSARTRLAELLDDRQLEYLASYYGLLQALKDSGLYGDISELHELRAQVSKLQDPFSVMAKEVCRVETGRSRGWSQGMPVSTASSDPLQLLDVEE